MAIQIELFKYFAFDIICKSDILMVAEFVMKVYWFIVMCYS